MKPIGILPNSPVIDMIVAGADHNSQERCKFYKPKFGMKHSIPLVVFRR